MTLLMEVLLNFLVADDSSRLRGARRDILYINECNNVTFDAYNEIVNQNQDGKCILDFNPANEFWVHNELQHETDADFIILTYKDNEGLDEGIVSTNRKESLKSKNKRILG